MKFLEYCRGVLLRAWSSVRDRMVPDAGAITKRAWSLRFIELAAAADTVFNLVPYVADYLPWWLTVALLIAAWAGRLLKQPEKEAVDGYKA